MTVERWERIKEIFAEAEGVERHAQQALIEARADGDAELVKEVERLLAHSPGVAFIDRRPFPGGMLQAAGAAVIAPGDMLAGRFRIRRLVGAGGMGEVYEAEDTKLQQTIAIKTIRPEIAHNADATARFKREISLARQVTHPGVCRVYDFFSHVAAGGGVSIDFLTMEYVEGETLSARLRRDGAMELAEALPVIQQLGAALDAAHQSRVIHRDLKSSNIILGRHGDGSVRAVITDFGLARSAAGKDAFLTGSGATFGTPAYMAPEQMEGKEPTTASDMYSLGVVMYEMATCETPHGSDSPMQIAARRTKEPPQKPSELVEMDAGWEAAILRCLELNPADRFESGAALAAAIGKQAPWRLPRVALPRPGRLAAVGIAVMALAVLGWWGRDWIPSQSVGEQPARLYRDGVFALSDGAYFKASQLLELALKAAPEFAVARCRLAEAYQELDQRDRAREELMKALDATMWARPERLLRDGTRAYLTGDWTKAAGLLRARVESVKDAERTTALLDLARLYDRAGLAAEAMQTYREVVARDASQPGAHLRLAVLLQAAGKGKEARGELDQAETLYRVGQNAEGQGLVLLARAEMETKAGESVELAKRAEGIGGQIQSPSLLIQAKLQQARRMDYQGKGEEALAVANEAVAIAETNGLGALAARGFGDLGMTFFSQRKIEEAERTFLRGLQLAQRFAAKRTEALIQVNLGHLYSFQTETGRLEKAGPVLTAAAEFFEANGEKSRALQALRYRADAMRALGKAAEAEQEYQRILARSETEADRAAIQTSIAKEAHTRGRFGVAAQMFLESAAYYNKVGDKQTGQNYEMWEARALRQLNKLDEAAAVLEGIRKAGPANETVRKVLEGEMAGLDFDRMRFDESFARYEKMLAAAEEKQEKSNVLSYGYSLCLRYAEAGRAAQSIAMCTPLLEAFRQQTNRLMLTHQALGIALADAGKPREAIGHARQAVELARKGKDWEDIAYSLLVLTQALYGARDAGWVAAREEAWKAVGEWEKAAGKEFVDGYFRRPITGRRLTAVQGLK